MIRIKQIFLLLALLGQLFSCEEPDGEALPDTPRDGLVIQSVMTDKLERQEVKITRIMPLPSDTPEPVRGARVFLSNDDTVIVFREDSLKAGVYFSSIALEVLKNYTLQVFFNEQVYSAKAKGEPGMVFNPPVFQLNGADSLWYPVYVAPPYMPDHPAMYELTADWSNIPGFSAIPAHKCKARMLFFTLPSIDVTQLLPPPSLSKGFPSGTLITVRRYALDMSYAAYWREVLLETRWAAGLFALETANVPSNFTSGARGWFAICGVTELSLVVGQ